MTPRLAASRIRVMSVHESLYSVKMGIEIGIATVPMRVVVFDELMIMNFWKPSRVQKVVVPRRTNTMIGIENRELKGLKVVFIGVMESDRWIEIDLTILSQLLGGFWLRG